MKAAVLGAGSWGTTFAAVLADAGNDVRIWGRDEETCREIDSTHTNARYLPGVALPGAIGSSTDAAWVLDGAEIVAIAIPSKAARGVLSELRPAFEAATAPGAIAVSLIKGIELGTECRMSEMIAQALDLPDERIAVVSGPNLAKEIAVHQPTATVVASRVASTAEKVADACWNDYFRPYTNTDLVGVELCGAVKNVIALVVGMAQGMGYGHNTTATVITRGLAEITRLGLAQGAHLETFVGLAGCGDLFATCDSPLSRNHILGRRIGEGMSLDEAVAAVGTTAESVVTCQSVLVLAERLGVEMPITKAVEGLLFGKVRMADVVAMLLSRPRKQEGI